MSERITIPQALASASPIAAASNGHMGAAGAGKRARPAVPPAPRMRPSLRALAALEKPGRREDDPRAGDHWLPWLISSTFNIGLIVIAAFIIYVAGDRLAAHDQLIIIPNSFEDPALSEHPGGVPHAGEGGDPSRDAAQNLKDIAKSQGWAASESNAVAPNSGGGSGADEALKIIALGAGAGAGGDASGGGGVAAYGVPGGGAGNGPKSSFYGTGGNASRIVYLIDRTGSMDTVYGAPGENEAGTVKGEVSRSVSALVPLQFFSVVVFTGPEDGAAQTVGAGALLRATPDNKQMVLSALSRTVPQGGNGDDDIIIKAAFRKALALNPQLIYFLTDGNVSPAVVEDLRQLNKDHKVAICAIKFTDTDGDNAEAGSKKQMDIVSKLATENGGMAKEIKR